MHTCLKALDIKNACQVHSAECVSKIDFILWIIFYAIHGAVGFQFARFSFDDCENICTSVLLSNQKYEPLAIV